MSRDEMEAVLAESALKVSLRFRGNAIFRGVTVEKRRGVPCLVAHFDSVVRFPVNPVGSVDGFPLYYARHNTPVPF